MKKNVSIVIMVLLFGVISCAPTKDKAPWQDLFNGKDLSGWTQKNGEAIYSIEGDAIVGKTVLNTPNSFLCTEEIFGDFILEYEAKVDNQLNSGVQIRSNSDPEYRNGRVHGYQVEIDPSDRDWTAGIYDEARRGWLYPLELNPDALGTFKREEWNHFRVECIGDHIKTYLNGVPVANLWDEKTGEGFIALQVHSVGDDPEREGLEVRWRNIRIITEEPANYAKTSTAPEHSRLINKLTEQEKKEGWKLLFDGETHQGWRRAYDDVFPEKGWSIKDGVITVEESGGAESRHGGDIVTEEEFSDFELQLSFKITQGANSGIKYYVTEKEKNNPGSAIGLEYQILDDKHHPDAKKGNHEGSRTLASLYDLIKAENKRFSGIGKWNVARIVSRDNHVEHYLNGIKVLEFDRGSENYRKLVAESKYAKWENFGEAESGHILLQDHGNRVSFRSIKIKPLQ